MTGIRSVVITCILLTNIAFHIHAQDGPAVIDQIRPGGSQITDNRVPTSSNWTNGADCYRKCGSEKRVCYFEWYIQRYTVLSPACKNCSSGVMADCWASQCIPADGVTKGVIVVNRRNPGPPIQVCKGDTLIIDVYNQLGDEATTIHWHGIRMMTTPYMDGVPMVTQCPIPPFTRFRYTFPVPEAGTFWYHSHVGSQRLDGLVGSLIVRQANELYRDLYDKDLAEHVILIQDWIHLRGVDFTPGLHLEGVDQVPDAVLINGIGPMSVNGTNQNIPISNFTVEAGKRYRFRIIGATSMTCTFAVKFQAHKMTVISADGGLNVKPQTIDTLGINSAERFDVVIHANQTPGDYYIFVQSLNDFCRGIRQIAVLHYASASNNLYTETQLYNPPPTGSFGTFLNNPNSTCEVNSTSICVSDLKGERDAPRVRGTNAVYVQQDVAFGDFELDFQRLFESGTYDRYEEPVYGRYVQYLINNISFEFPSSPFITQFNDIPQERLCQPECRNANQTNFCRCANYYNIPKNAVTDLLVYDTGARVGGFNHPFHLHGYNFYVLSQGVLPENFTEADLQRLRQDAARDNLSLDSRPRKDTISISARGYAQLRFTADNPGWWLLHCHFDYHLENGMAAVFHVGRQRDLPPVPADFPKCGDF